MSAPTLDQAAAKVVEALQVVYYADLIDIASRQLYDFQQSHMRGYAVELARAYRLQYWGTAYERIRAVAAETFLAGVRA